MLKLIVPWVFQLSTWTSLQRTFSLFSSAYMYGCQLCFAHVLCCAFIFAIHFFLSLAKCGQMLTICLSCLVFSRYATDWTLLIPFLALSSIFVFYRHNLELILDRFLFIIPCVFPAFYMYIIEPILGFVYLRYWIPVKGRLRMAFLDLFLTGFNWLQVNQYYNLHQ